MLEPLTGPRAEALRAEVEEFMEAATEDIVDMMRRHGVEDAGEAVARTLMVYLGAAIGGVQRSAPGVTIETFVLQVRYQWMEIARARGCAPS